VGVFWMSDEKGPDAKIICVPVDDPRTSSGRVTDLADLPSHLLKEIEHFFEVYKLLEPGKESSTRGYEGREAAWREIAAARARAKPDG
ncbi:MAG: inorganic diphosphatase, partial [Acidimicrobiia bacterium]